MFFHPDTPDLTKGVVVLCFVNGPRYTPATKTNLSMPNLILTKREFILNLIPDVNLSNTFQITRKNPEVESAKSEHKQLQAISISSCINIIVLPAVCSLFGPVRQRIQKTYANLGITATLFDFVPISSHGIDFCHCIGILFGYKLTTTSLIYTFDGYICARLLFHQ